MREELDQILRSADNQMHALNLAREYLQARILLAMQEAGVMIPLAFQGGTALRFLFGLPRFSEDLDFALERPDRSDVDVSRLGHQITRRLDKEGYEVTTSIKSGLVVESLMVLFPELLHDLGLSPHRTQRLRIRVEIDTKPPEGAGITTTIIRRHVLVNLQHHDRPSLLAGKLHAVLQRPWTKGRDLFDLFWYLSDPAWPHPNLGLLNNALEQTGWNRSPLQSDTWRPVVGDHVASLDWKVAEEDVAPFLVPGSETALFGRENLLELLGR